MTHADQHFRQNIEPPQKHSTVRAWLPTVLVLALLVSPFLWIRLGGLSAQVIPPNVKNLQRNVDDTLAKNQQLELRVAELEKQMKTLIGLSDKCPQIHRERWKGKWIGSDVEW